MGEFGDGCVEDGCEQGYNAMAGSGLSYVHGDLDGRLQRVCAREVGRDGTRGTRKGL